MRRSLAPLCVLLAFLCLAETITPQGVPLSAGATAQEPVAAASALKPDAVKPAFMIPEDTPVRLRLEETISSGTAKVNDKVQFVVMQDVKIGEIVVMAQGDSAIATVTEAHTKKSFGRAGKLIVSIDYVQTTDGNKATLRAVKGGSGGSHTAAMTGAVVASAILFFPAAPLFFFIKGKNITIPKGTEITAYVSADTPFTPRPEDLEALDRGLATVTVRSTPDGAEIELDDKFVGTTQSVLKLAAGEHTFRIKKAGFQDWTRTVSLSAGSSISIEAAMEK